MVALWLLALAVLCCDFAEARADSWAELMAGVAGTTGSHDYQQVNESLISRGDAGTAMAISGRFPVWGRLMWSPSAWFVRSPGRSRDLDADNPRTDDAVLQQAEVAIDLMHPLPGAPRIALGAGIASAWWTAAVISAHPYSTHHDDRRLGRGQDLLARGILRWDLRNPAIAGAFVRGIVAVPVSDAPSSGGSAAGYVGAGIGFAMPLSRR
ncbi:hypothetical protein HZB60_07255 [candidate division KSB1 bacterium]|nr:hypothetical protein [candidate division KSB1 bacterium]